MTGALQEKYLVSAVTEDDLPAAAALLAKVYETAPALWTERFKHWWDRNPSWSSEIVRGWAVKRSSGELLGFMAAVPFVFTSVDGQRLQGSGLSTLGVHPSARGLGLARMIGDAAMLQKADIVIGTQSSEAAWRMWMSAGMRELPEAWPRECRLMIGNPTSFAKRIGISKGIAWGLVTTPLAIGLRATAQALQLVTGRNTQGVRVELSGGFLDEDNADLSILSAKPARVRPLRDAATLNWMYFGSEYVRQSRFVLVARRNSSIVGYVGLRIHKGALFLLECRTGPGSEDVAKILMREARKLAVQRGFPYVLVYCYSKEIKEALAGILSVRAPATQWFTYCFRAEGLPFNMEELETGPWDGDSPVL